ncbi:kelch repeat-containing protein [Erythrobacter sp. JK5]|uniref:Kelch repeat-containing protein n=1 Tax=Erythrobacter sp. JK5 TaxID=2829500 RepID=UPI001BACA933|nr:kelch repeat-containing protein [Erythrobacter sp. JK5]QUL37852.1 hypothetical protein KDC96_16255 [Erythrobacter sp. JK5]
MSDARSEIYAAELGGTIYTAGGIGFFRTLSTCAAFDTRSQTFNPCPDLPRSLHHVAMAAGEGQVFASGGYTSLPFNQDEDGAVFALAIDRGAERWEELAKLPQPLGQHTMVYFGGALWLVGGDSRGKTVATLRRYDLATGIWGERAPMPTARNSHAVATDDERLYVTGGRSATLGGHSTVIEAYDFASDSWQTLPDAPYPLAGHGAAVVGGRLHVFGGENLDTAEVFVRHVSIDLAALESGWREEAPLPEPRHGFATAAVDGTIWVLGGGKRAGIRTPWSVTGTALALDPQ